MSDNQRTRPSEAQVADERPAPTYEEVTAARCLYIDHAGELSEEMQDAFCTLSRAITSLRTPPLPSAEPVAWQCVVCDEVNPATKMHCGRCGTLGMRATTPPAAAQEAPC